MTTKAKYGTIYKNKNITNFNMEVHSKLKFFYFLLSLLIAGLIIYIVDKSNAKYIPPKKDHFYRRIVHLNGHPYIPRNKIVDFDIIDNKIYLTTVSFDEKQTNEEYKEEIDPKNILRCEVKNEQEITYDVTIPRMLLLGPLAFADKKKNVRENHYYLYLSYTIKGVEVNCLFESSSDNIYDIQTQVTRLKIETAHA